MGSSLREGPGQSARLKSSLLGCAECPPSRTLKTLSSRSDHMVYRPRSSVSSPAPYAVILSFREARAKNPEDQPIHKHLPLNWSNPVE